MGIIEGESRKRKNRRDIQRIVLGSVAMAGTLGVAVVAPNVIVAMKRMGIEPGKREKEIILRARQNLLKKGLLVRHGAHLSLSARGEQAMRLWELEERIHTPPEKWDGRWRVLAFDIPEKRRVTRVRIRHLLQKIGCVRLQDSVWLYPYECEDIITLAKADLKVGKDFLYLIVDFLEYDARYRAHFGLK